MTLQEEIARRQKEGLPPLTADEEKQFESTVSKTAVAEDNMSEIGSVRTDTQHGSKVVSGPYKGLHPTRATQLALKGDARPPSSIPRARGHSGPLTEGGGMDGFYAMNPHLDPRPSAAPPMARGRPPVFQNVAAAPRSAASPPLVPVGGSLLPSVMATVGTAAFNKASQTTADQNASAGIASGLRDASQDVRERGPNSVTWNNGASVSGAAGSKTLVSPYGSGSSSAAPPGIRPSDPNLVAEINAIKGRQSQGIYDPNAPSLARGPSAAPPAVAAAQSRPQPASRPPVSAAAPPAARGIDPMFQETRGFGPTGPVAGPNDRLGIVAPLRADVPQMNAETAARAAASRPPRAAPPGISPAAPRLAPGPTNLTGAPLDPMARTAANINPAGRTTQGAAPPRAPTTPQPLDWSTLNEGQSNTLRSIAADDSTVERKILPVLNPTQWTPQSKAAPILAGAGVTGIQPSYPSPAARVEGDNVAVTDLEKNGQLKLTTSTNAGGVPVSRVQVGSARPPILQNDPASMAARRLNVPRTNTPPSARPPTFVTR